MVEVGMVHRGRAQDESEDGEGGGPAGRLVAEETSLSEAPREEDQDDAEGQQ